MQDKFLVEIEHDGSGAALIFEVYCKGGGMLVTLWKRHFIYIKRHYIAGLCLARVQPTGPNPEESRFSRRPTQTDVTALPKNQQRF